METALQIKRNAEEQRVFQINKEIVQELLEWEDQVQKKPIKRIPLPPPRAPQPRIKSNDYRKWDTFDVDRALEDVDYEPFKEDELFVDTTEPKDPEEALVEKEKGNLYFKKAKFLKAISCYSKSFELDHTVPIPLVNRALCFIKLKKYDNAIEDCTKALAMDSKNVKAAWRRGLAYKELGKVTEAQKDFEYALVLEPSNATVKKDLEEVVAVIKGTAKPKRRIVPIQDVNKPTAAKAAEEQTKAIPIQMKEQRVPPKIEKMEPSTNLNIEPAVNNQKVKSDIVQVPSKVETASPTVETEPREKQPVAITTVKQDSPSVPIKPSNSPVVPKTSSNTTPTVFKEAFKRPTNLFDFEKQWKSYPQDSVELLDFLRQFSGQELALIFKDSFDSNYLTTSLQLIDTHLCKNGKEEEARSAMKQISKVRRFDILSKFIRKGIYFSLDLKPLLKLI